MTPQAATITDPTPAAAFAGDDERWEAVGRRDARADGAFYYSVATTGVYCRPSCPSRPARRENVAFHPTREAAERAGFRACRRCRPDAAAPAERQAEAVAAACRAIDATLEGGDAVPSLDALAAAAGLSPFHFHRVFRQIAGVTPKGYEAARRAARVREGLAAGGSVTGAIYDAGYGSSSRFYERSTGLLGMTPVAYREGGPGAEIRFAVGECSLGAVLVAATARGVCAIRLGDDPDALVRGLQDSFPRARLVGADPAFEDLVARVVGLVEAPRRAPDPPLPLDVRGTAFQQRVWEALRTIPPGRTATYAEVAARIGAPRAVRAVANACASNPMALAIPCHRVVRTDGSTSGYAWGVERKRELLAREAAA